MVTLYIVLFFFILFSSVPDTLGSEGCMEDIYGIACCSEGFTIGDNANEDREKFIHPKQYEIGCKESCKKQHPTSIGITESLKQKYTSGKGVGRNKCWCELQYGSLDETNKNYKTCHFSSASVHSAVCTNYIELKDSWRNINYLNTISSNSAQFCDRTQGDRWDDRLHSFTNLAEAWYRFTATATSQLPTAPASRVGLSKKEGTPRYCGTGYTAYIASGGNPTRGEGIVTRNVCFELDLHRCVEGDTTIKVAACEGGYFVYQLKPTPSWNCFGYCAISSAIP